MAIPQIAKKKGIAYAMNRSALKAARECSRNGTQKSVTQKTPNRPFRAMATTAATGREGHEHGIRASQAPEVVSHGILTLGRPHGHALESPEVLDGQSGVDHRASGQQEHAAPTPSVHVRCSFDPCLMIRIALGVRSTINQTASAIAPTTVVTCR
jgi:hypothetical protein